MGGYSGLNLRIRSRSPSAVLQRRFAAVSPSTRLLFSAGAVNGANRTDQIAAAVHTSEQAEATILLVGDTHVAEFADRTANCLEASQVELATVNQILRSFADGTMTEMSGAEH